MVPSFISAQISVTNHNLIPELLVVPILFHFSEHLHKFILSPVYELKMTFLVLENFKDHVVELNIVGLITPLFDGIVSILFHLNHNLDTFLWNT